MLKKWTIRKIFGGVERKVTPEDIPVGIKAERGINEYMERMRNEGHHGGLIVEKSPCCNARIAYREGMLRIPYCSKCGRPYKELRLRNNNF
jgi:hypothetical protein